MRGPDQRGARRPDRRPNRRPGRRSNSQDGPVTPSRNMNPALMALVAEGFLMRLSFGIIAFALPLYARHLGLSLAETGALIALTGVVKVALKPVMGWLADRVGTKRGLVAGLGLRSLVSFLLAFATTPWQIY